MCNLIHTHAYTHQAREKIRTKESKTLESLKSVGLARSGYMKRYYTS